MIEAYIHQGSSIMLHNLHGNPSLEGQICVSLTVYTGKVGIQTSKP